MVRIRQTAQVGAKKVKALGDRSMETTSIVSTISRISEQTNMLGPWSAPHPARGTSLWRSFIVGLRIRTLP